MTLLTWQRQSASGLRAFNLHRRSWKADEVCPAHRHDYGEVFWLEEGGIMHRWEGEEELLAAGDLVALVPGEEHGFRCPERCVLVNASFSVPALAGLRGRYGAGLPWPWEGERSQRRRSIDRQGRDRLAALVALADPRLPHSRDLLLLGLLHVLVRDPGSRLAELPLPWRRAIAELLDQPESGISAARLARRLRCSREHLSRCVRRLTGRPLAGLLRELRLQRAEAHLLAGGTPAAAGQSAGFSSLSGFYAAFRTRHRATPEAWRRRALTAGGGLSGPPAAPSPR